MDPPRPRLVLVRGGRTGTSPAEAATTRTALRVIPGGPAADVQADLERAIEHARRIREEIQARIARALDDPPPA